jgi:hypothetical protein
MKKTISHCRVGDNPSNGERPEPHRKAHKTIRAAKAAIRAAARAISFTII